jgi:hypothetical protein
MWHTTLWYTEVAEEPAAFWDVVSSATESMLGHSPGNTACAEVVSELVVKFQKVEMHHSKLEWPTTRICDLMLGPLPSWAWLTDHLDEVATWLKVEQVTRWEVEAELEDMRSSAALVRDLVLGDVGGSSLMVTSMSAVTEQLEGWIDTATTNRVCWGSHSALVVMVLHFPELDADLEVLGSGHNAGLAKDEINHLRSWVCAVVDLLSSHIPSSVARSPPDSVGE